MKHILFIMILMLSLESSLTRAAPPLPMEIPQGEGTLGAFDPDRPVACSPQFGPVERDSSGNILPGCPIDGDNYTIVDFAKDVYEDGTKTVKCGGVIIATAAVCGLATASLISCIDGAGNSDSESRSATTDAEVCTKNDQGEINCVRDEIPSWMASCIFVLPTGAGCIDFAQKIPEYCW